MVKDISKIIEYLNDEADICFQELELPGSNSYSLGYLNALQNVLDYIMEVKDYDQE